MCDDIDIYEDHICELSPEVLEVLLTDHSRSHTDPLSDTHIIWATDDYAHLGTEYTFHKPITVPLITGDNGHVIMPRVAKSHSVQQGRVRQRAEVFTPTWVCNAQNNLIDEAWFGCKDVFNTELPDHSWVDSLAPIVFPEGRSWYDYVSACRMEMACGEAPYLTSRYDATSGEFIPIAHRVGLLDRKLRVISENCANSTLWLKAAQRALQSIYAFEWQGDSLLIARENLLYSFIDAYQICFGRLPQLRSIKYAAYIISWNVVQMDGLKYVVPETCHPEQEGAQTTLFNEMVSTVPCPGCFNGSLRMHNGIRTLVRDWTRSKKHQIIPFLDLIQ